MTGRQSHLASAQALSRKELQGGGFRHHVRKAAQTANLLFDLMTSTTGRRARASSLEDNGSVYLPEQVPCGPGRGTRRFPEQRKPTFPTPVTFGINSDEVPDDLNQSVHQAYIKVVDRLRVAGCAPIEQLSFTTSPFSAT